MAQSINTSYAVIVLGDGDTVQRFDLSDKAAERGATIVETYSFEPGFPRTQDDLADVEAVVAALSRAIATRTDLWVPFPMDDLGREEHVRRVSLVLQRHGLNMVMGSALEPCTTDGGFSPVDFALRTEVRAVDDLDYAALAGAGMKSLFAEIAEALAEVPGQQVTEVASPAPGGAERLYGTGEVARFFGKSVQWVNRGIRSGVFTYPDGSLIEPIRSGRNQRRRYSLPVLAAMARACYRRGIVGEEELLDLLAVLDRAEAE